MSFLRGQLRGQLRGFLRGGEAFHQERFKNSGIASFNGSALFRFKGVFEGEAKLKLS